MPMTPPKMYGISTTTPQVMTGPKTPVKAVTPTPVRTTTTAPQTMAKSFGPKYYAKGGMTASKRADGCAQRGKTRGKFL